jgi:hypothetical protein
MVEHPEWGIHAYQTVEEPLRAVLAGGLWGAEQELVTTYFQLHFRQLDAKTVATAAPQLDALYATMRQNFGLPTPPPAAKMHIQVSEQYLRATVPYRPRNVDQLTVSSPALYPTLAPWTAADLFTQSVVLLLVDQLLAEAVDQHKIGAARDPLLHGLRLWQLWDLTLPLATHQQALVHWIYRDLPAVQPAAAPPMPADYPLFCTIHQLWMDHPAQLQLPFLCTEQDRLPGRLAPRLLQRPPTQLPWLHAPIYLDEEADGQGRTRATAHPGQAIALATVIDYIVVTYGRARLADFVANLNRYNRWEDLIPALFGLSAAEFEGEWQRFVRAEGRFP